MKLTLPLEDPAIPVATLSLFRFADPLSQLRVVGQMAVARGALRRDPRLRFFKLCGSGTGEGFTPRPNRQVWAIFAVWASDRAAREATADSPVWGRWRARATEAWTVFLDPISARGSWSGVSPILPDPVRTAPAAGPVAALTRATLRPGRALRFWRRVPDISAAIGANEDVLFKIGIGEMPLLHQVTFSIWPDSASMAAFARANGPHAEAIRAVREGNWFAEELYARFGILGTEGHWGGVDPLANKLAEREAA